jgi:antitoxin component of MazEF toxin-antitoxin module
MGYVVRKIRRINVRRLENGTYTETYGVAIPKDYLEILGLKPGDKVIVEIIRGAIVIRKVED